MPYIGKSPLHGNYSKLDDFSGDFDGSDATHALAINGISLTPVTEAAVLISINGVLQEPVTDYTVSGTNITFTTAPASGANFFGVVLGEQLSGNTPSNSTITSAKLAGTFLTGATDIGAAIVDADLFLVDDGAGGTLRKTAASRLKTYAGGSDPSSADGDTLGTASLEWSDLYLADGGVIYFGNDQEVTLTHNHDTSLTCNLMVAATTFEPTGDTAASDNAALGYTSVLGAILTGQGSTNDVTLVNDADATVLGIPTGTVNVSIAGDLIMANGEGIDFSARTAGNAGSTSQVFRNHEVGIYEPTLTGSTSGSLAMATNKTLAYAVNGQTCHVWGGLDVTSDSSLSGELTLSLPMAAESLTQSADRNRLGTIIMSNHGDGGLERPHLFIDGGGATYGRFGNITDAGGLENITEARVDAGFELYIDFSYRIAA